MSESKEPLDKGGFSEEQRAWMEMDLRAGRTVDPYRRPSRSKLGKLIDFLERMAGSGPRI